MEEWRTFDNNKWRNGVQLITISGEVEYNYNNKWRSGEQLITISGGVECNYNNKWRS